MFTELLASGSGGGGNGQFILSLGTGQIAYNTDFLTQGQNVNNYTFTKSATLRFRGKVNNVNGGAGSYIIVTINGTEILNVNGSGFKPFDVENVNVNSGDVIDITYNSNELSVMYVTEQNSPIETAKGYELN